MFARPMPTNGWVNYDQLNYHRVGVFPLTLLRALGIVLNTNDPLIPFNSMLK